MHTDDLQSSKSHSEDAEGQIKRLFHDLKPTVYTREAVERVLTTTINTKDNSAVAKSQPTTEATTGSGTKYLSPPATTTTAANAATNGAMTTTTSTVESVSAAADQRTSSSKVWNIRARHVIFKIGACLLFFSMFLFTIGISVNTWGLLGVRYKPGEVTQKSIGVWRLEILSSLPRRIDSDKLRGWPTLTRIFLGTALACFLAAIALFLYQEVGKKPPPTDRACLEIFIGAAVLTGIIGLVIFGVEWSKIGSLGWGFYLTTFTCQQAIVSCFLIAFSRHRHAAFTRSALANLGIADTSAPCPEDPALPTPATQHLSTAQPLAVMPPSTRNPQPTAMSSPTAMPPPTEMPPPPSGHVLKYCIMSEGHLVPVYGLPSTAATQETVGVSNKPPTTTGVSNTPAVVQMDAASLPSAESM